MRNVAKRLTFAVALIGSLWNAAMLFVDSTGNGDSMRRGQDFICMILIPPACFGVFVLAEWVLTGRSPWSRRMKPTA